MAYIRVSRGSIRTWISALSWPLLDQPLGGGMATYSNEGGAHCRAVSSLISVALLALVHTFYHLNYRQVELYT